MALFEEGQTGLRQRGSHNIGIRLEGEWVKFNDLFKQGDILLGMAAREGQKQFAEAYRDAVKKNMREGGRRFGYAELGEEYVQKKLKYGGDPGMFRWSTAMINSVEVKSNAKQTMYMVGIEKGLRRPDYYSGESNNLNIDEYANAIEHGFATKGVYVEPRPVFSDTFRITMGGIKGMRNFIEGAIIGKFAKRGIRVKKR